MVEGFQAAFTVSAVLALVGLVVALATLRVSRDDARRAASAPVA